MKKQLFFAAVASIALFSCTSDDLAGGDPGTEQGTEDAITFGSTFKAVTRAGDITGVAAANKLDNHFKVYGVKKVSSKWSNVFKDYIVWNSATSGDANWEYVGTTAQTYGAAQTALPSQQYIKYWDHSATDYHFVAGSPASEFDFKVDNADGDNKGNIKEAEVTKLGGRLNNTITVASNHAAVYVANPVKVAKTAFNDEVKFTFQALLSKVRVGIYETISGYKITSITFHDNASTPGSSNYITLNGTDGYFKGGTNVTGTVTYDWTTPGYTFAYTSGTSSDKCWKGGQYASGVPATTSTDTDLYGGADSNKDSNGYFIVLPTPSTTADAALSIDCDYTLESLDNSGEKIEVTHATATIPSDYTKWEPNKAYTYLFKITDSNLHPITFDAVVVETMNQGTTTTVSSPSITVYQDGDVVTNGITYKAGTVVVMAIEGNTDVTSTATWKYVELNSTDFSYSKDYEKLGASNNATTWTDGKLTTVTADKTYIIKCTTANGTAYFVLVVGGAETGPGN